MTTHMDTEAIREAKASNRDGAAREDRPDAVDEWFKPTPEVGFRQGLPLLDAEYEEYPEDPLKPAAGEDLAALADHELVGSVADLAAELDAREERVRKALALHDIEEPTGGGSFDVPEVERKGVIDVPLQGCIDTEHLRTPVYEDARLLEHLYVRYGCSVREIRTVLEEGMNRGRDGEKAPWRVREGEIRAALEDVALLDAADETDTGTAEDEDTRLGGTSLDARDEEAPGADVNYQKVRESPNIEIQPASE